MSNPNEVTDVEPKRTLMHSLTTGRAYLKPEYAEAALAEYVAQQNAALLREISEVNERGLFIDGKKTPSQLLEEHRAAVRSILEEKLKAIEEVYGR